MSTQAHALFKAKIRVLEMLEQGSTAGEISRELKISRLKVYDIINSAQKNIKVQLDAQIAGVVRDTIGTLAAMAEEIRADAELALDAKKLDLDLLQKRQVTMHMYCQLYDRAMKIVEKYWERTIPMASLPTDKDIEKQIKLLEAKRNEEQAQGNTDIPLNGGAESSDTESVADTLASRSNGDGVGGGTQE